MTVNFQFILSYLNKKGATNWDKKTVKEVLCSLRAKNLLNSNDLAESEENEIPNLPTADVVHKKPVELDKDVQPSNMNSQQASQEIISNPLTPARIGLPPPFSVYTPTSLDNKFRKTPSLFSPTNYFS